MIDNFPLLCVGSGLICPHILCASFTVLCFAILIQGNFEMYLIKFMCLEMCLL